MTYVSATTTAKHSTLLRVDGGFYDFCVNTALAPKMTTYLMNTTASKDYVYDTATATMFAYDTAAGTTTAGSTAYGTFASGGLETYSYQEGQELFDASFETVNIYFDDEAIEANPLVEMYLESTVSYAKAKISYASNGNYTVSTPTNGDLYSQGSPEETGYLGNTTVRYKGSKQIIVNKVDIDGTDAASIRFKIEAYLTDGTNTYLDDIKVKSIKVLPNDVIFYGGERHA